MKWTILEILPKPGARDLDDDMILDMSVNGVLIYPVREDDESISIPWDGGVSIEGNKFVAEGGMGPGGFGYCRCELPIDRVDYCYRLEIEIEEQENVEPIQQMLDEAGWSYKVQ